MQNDRTDCHRGLQILRVYAARTPFFIMKSSKGGVDTVRTRQGRHEVRIFRHTVTKGQYYCGSSRFSASTMSQTNLNGNNVWPLISAKTWVQFYIVGMTRSTFLKRLPKRWYQCYDARETPGLKKQHRQQYALADFCFSAERPKWMYHDWSMRSGRCSKYIGLKC